MDDLISFIETINKEKWKSEEVSLETGKLLYKNTPGVIEYIPHHSDSALIMAISVGIHGNETAPIEIVWDIIQKIKSQRILPKIRILFIFGHPQAMLAGKRFLGFNLNRLFSGNHKNFKEYLESERAQEIEEGLTRFFSEANESSSRWHLDLHTAIRGSHHQRFAVRPYYGRDLDVDQTELQICAAMGVEAILKTISPATTFAGFSATHLKAKSFTVELGSVAPFGKNDLSCFAMAKNTIIHILKTGLIHELPQETKPLVYDVKKELINDHDDYEFYIADDYLNFTPLTQGQAIEKNKEGILEAKKNQSIVFPNPHVPQGQRTGLLVQPQGHIPDC